MPFLVVVLREGESVMIGDDIEVVLKDVRKSNVDVGVAAPRELKLSRLDDVVELDLDESMPSE